MSFSLPIMAEGLISLCLCQHSLKYEISTFTGFVDSLSVFRKKYPKRSSYKQEDLAKDILNTTYNAHNAIGDVESLGQLIGRTNMSAADLLAYSFPPQATYNSMLVNRLKSKNVSTLDILVAKGVCKRTTAENIAGSGLQLCHLRTIYRRDGEDVLLNSFTEKTLKANQESLVVKEPWKVSFQRW